MVGKNASAFQNVLGGWDGEARPDSPCTMGYLVKDGKSVKKKKDIK